METLSEKIAEIVKSPVETTNLVEDTEYSPKEVIRELKEVIYASKDVLNFDDFKKDGCFPTEGEYSFSIDSKHLKYACGILKHVSLGSKVLDNLVKIVVSDNQIKISGFNQISFAEIWLPLSKFSSVPKDNEIALVVDYQTLSKIVASFENAALKFTYFPEKLLLTLDSGNTHFELITREGLDFTNYHNNIQEIKLVEADLDIDVLKTALEYLFLFIKKNQPDNLSIFECRNDAIYGGSISSVGIFQSPSLQNVSFKIKQESAQILNKVLPYFYRSKLKLFETNNYYLLRDQNLYLGLEKATVSFPSLKHLLSLKPDDTYCANRKELLSALNKVSAISDNKEVLIQCKIVLNSMQISLKDMSGRTSRDSVAIKRQGGKAEEHHFLIPLDTFSKALLFHKTSDVLIQEIINKAILIKDTCEKYSTTTIISCTTEAK